MARLNFDDYRIVLITPLMVEAQAAWHMLDKEHEGEFPTSPGDDFMYSAGEINGHNVAVATFPSGGVYGVGSAAALAAQIKNTFRKLWFGLLVGVAAGLPDLHGEPKRDIRLGDVLVGLGDGNSAGLVSYGLGKETSEGFKILEWGIQAKTIPILRSAIAKMRLRATTHPHTFLQHYEKIKGKPHEEGVFEDPGQEKDILYEKIIDQEGQRTQPVHRELRSSTTRTKIWYGKIGSGDRLIKNADERDRLRNTFDLIGLEMEAAGTMNSIDVAVIRGVCDYGDAQKNKEWQPYAAAMAAAYARAILYSIPAETKSKGIAKLEETARNQILVDEGPKKKVEEHHGRF